MNDFDGTSTPLSEHERTAIQDRLNGPAIGLMVVAGLSLAVGLFGIASRVLTGPPDLSPLQGLEGVDQYLPLIESMTSGPISWASTFVGMVVAAIILFGAIKMRSLQSWGLAVAASFLSMIPCFTSCCCLLGLVFGIWALVLLFKPEVKGAFA